MAGCRLIHIRLTHRHRRQAISGLVRAERAEVSRGVIEYVGADLAGIVPSQRVRQGMVHVLEGRHVFGQLTVRTTCAAAALFGA